MSDAPGWLRALMLALPRSFRCEYGEAMNVHVEWMRLRTGGAAARARFYLVVAVDILTVGVQERLLGDATTRWSRRRIRRAGRATVTGGVLALAVTPLMVMVKYATGWQVIPRPAWEPAVRSMVAPLVSFASPVTLWMLYGAAHTTALVLMTFGLRALRAKLGRSAGRVGQGFVLLLLLGMSLVIVGEGRSLSGGPPSLSRAS